MGSLSHSIQTFVAAHGLEAVFLLMVLESACIPVPSEVTMIYAGYLVSQGDMSFVAAVVVGAFANLVVVDRLGSGVRRRRLALPHGAKPRHAEQPTGGSSATGRRSCSSRGLVPSCARSSRSRPGGADAARRFSVLTFAGCLLWSTVLVAIGNAAGANWETWHHRLGDLDYLIVAAAAALVGVWLLRRRRSTAE